jgi:hypothetical protein
MLVEFLMDEIEFEGLKQVIVGVYKNEADRTKAARKQWMDMGEKYGFEWRTVEPIKGQSRRFLAIPTTKKQK